MGAKHHSNPEFMERTAEEDINHVRKFHAEVRLREAEHFASEGDYEMALEKLESAIGYLVILHYRVNERLDEE